MFFAFKGAVIYLMESLARTIWCERASDSNGIVVLDLDPCHGLVEEHNFSIDKIVKSLNRKVHRKNMIYAV